MKNPGLAMLVLTLLLLAGANLVDADILDGLVAAWSFDGNLRDSVGGNDAEFFSGGTKPKGESGPANPEKGIVGSWDFDGNLRDGVGSNNGEFMEGDAEPPANDKPKVDSGPVNPADGIVGAWDFDGDLYDDIEGNDGEFWGAPAQNKPVYVDGQFGRAIEFDGIDDYIEIPDDEAFHLPEGLTVAAWINIKAGGDHAAICWKGEQIGWGSNYSWRVCLTSDTGMTWGRCTAASEAYFATAGVLPGTREWIHVALTCMSPDAPTSQRAYVNGEDITDVTDQAGNLNVQPPFLTFDGEPVILGVGRSVNGNIGEDTYFNGLIDDLGIWDRGLTAEEVEEVMDRGLPSRFSVDARGKMATTWGRLKR